MEVKRLSAVIAIALIVGLMVAGCGPTPTPTTPPPTQPPAQPTQPPAQPTQAPAKPAPEAIEIGASIPLTGKYGSLGVQVKAGYELAVQDINAAGGVYVKEFDQRIPIRLTIYDDESDPTKAVSKLEALYAEQNVVAYLGGAASDMHAATVPIAEKNKVPYCGVAFALWKIHQQGFRYLFSPFPKSPTQAEDTFKILNAAILEGQRPTKVAIFQETTDWGVELGGLWKEYAAKYGYEVVAYETYAPRSENFSDMILRAKAAGAEALLAVPNQPDGIAMVKQMSELGWTPKFMLLIRAPENPAWYEALGPLGDYAAIFPGWSYKMKWPMVADLVQKHQAAYGRPPDVLVGPAYTCVQVVADAIERAGTLDREAIRDAMAATNLQNTPIGPVQFREDGTGIVLNPMVQWQNGQIEVVWPPEHASAPLAYPAPPFDQR